MNHKMQVRIRSVQVIITIIALLSTGAVLGQAIDGFDEYMYKKVDTVELKIHVRQPERAGKKRLPTIVFFYGGGWNGGRIDQFLPHAEYLASKGMISILADYRVKTRHNTTPFDAVADARSCIRFIRKNARKLGIDPHRIAVAGGSAGGHLAAACALIGGINDPRDNLKIDPRPDALILFNPVVDNGPSGYGYERIGERYTEISPLHNLEGQAPPTIVFLGTNDRLIPVETVKLYRQKMEALGSRCDLFLYEGQNHGFFNYREGSDNRFYHETLKETETFLQSLGYIK